jgi:phosphatidylserine decarboxylase
VAKTLEQWIESEVAAVREKPLSWISQEYFFRDPSRPIYSNPGFFYSPADGIILYQVVVEPDEPIVEIKGTAYSLRDAMRDDSFDRPSLVIGIFMTFYDVHVNRVPYAGRLSYKELEPIDTYNYPMLAVEHDLLDELRVDPAQAGYLHNNQRVLNRVYSTELGQHYYILQIADYDVDCITPFELKQNQPFAQNQRFSQIRYGSQVDLIIPLSGHLQFAPIHETAMHVEAGVDVLVAVHPSLGTDPAGGSPPCTTPRKNRPEKPRP